MTPINSTSPALDTWTELSGFHQLRAQARSDGGKDAHDYQWAREQIPKLRAAE